MASLIKRGDIFYHQYGPATTGDLYLLPSLPEAPDRTLRRSLACSTSTASLCYSELRKVRQRMAIPEFQAFMLPLLKYAADGSRHTLAEAREALAVTLRITPEERDELLPSGNQSRFDNRVT